ncbi:MAG: (2Fe-2S)-binding protein [Alphaproteobacteria bacterium]|nr:(2Fe-2S)-binding protein [Alphaproteobacteria bacterium]
MYVCLCNRLTDRAIRDAVAAGAGRVAEVYRACGCAAQCGACCRTVRQLVEEAAYPVGHPLLAAAE